MPALNSHSGDITMATQAENHDFQASSERLSVPTLSVTVLNYNYARYLPQCLDSILRQTFTDFELILINDCSTDNSLEVIEPYLADPRVKLVNHEQNKGYIFSLIEGSELSHGKYITVISADDYCVSDRAFEALLRTMEADGDIAFAYGAHGNYGKDGVRTYLSRPHDESLVRAGVDEYRDLLTLGNYIMHSGVIIRATAYKAVGGYDCTVIYCTDAIMWLMLCGQGKVAYCADELFAYRFHGSNMSTDRSGIRPSLHEMLYGLDKSFAVMRQFPEVSHDLYMRGVRRNLTGSAVGGVFAGDVLGGWYAYWCSLTTQPIWTVWQSSTLIMIARTVLGQRGYEVLRSLLHRHRASVAPA
jgi:glycosyltransferase involved in cell wall biosynthesis